jgi:hypothetical protein
VQKLIPKKKIEKLFFSNKFYIECKIKFKKKNPLLFQPSNFRRSLLAYTPTDRYVPPEYAHLHSSKRHRKSRSVEFFFPAFVGFSQRLANPKLTRAAAHSCVYGGCVFRFYIPFFPFSIYITYIDASGALCTGRSATISSSFQYLLFFCIFFLCCIRCVASQRQHQLSIHFHLQCIWCAYVMA